MDSYVLTYSYRLLLTKAQHRALERMLEDQRQLYNAALEERIACYQKTGKSRSYVDQTKALTECRRLLPHMAATPMTMQRATLQRLDKAYQAFFRRAKTGSVPGFPRFKGKNWFKSLGFSEFKGVRLVGNRLLIHGMGSGIRVHMHRPLPEGKILSCQIKRDSKGWVVNFALRAQAAPKRAIATLCGLDMGITTLGATSDGILIPNPRAGRKAERKMRTAARALARCKNGTKRRRKVKAEVTRLHAKIANTRRTYLHQKSAMLVKTYDLIAIEALNVKGLAAGMLAREVNDVAWGIFIAMLRYKAERAGAQLIEVDPRHTSQTCPECGTRAKKTLAERVHDCSCGCVLDRDVAAARVILDKAVAGLGTVNVAQRGERRFGNLNAS